MAKRKHIKPYTNDGLVNVNKALGTAKDKAWQTTYTRSRFIDEYLANELYSTNWLASRIVDTPINEATREWRDMKMEADEEKEWRALEKKLRLKENINSGLKWGDVFGGAITVIITDDDDLSNELNINAITPDTKIKLVTIDRWNVSISTPSQDLFSDNFGKPEFYYANESGAKIHYSRVIRYDGIKPTIRESRRNNHWGNSIYLKCYDPITQSQESTDLIRGLLYQSNVDVFKIAGFNELLASNMDDLAIKRITLANGQKSINNGIALDGEDEYINITKNFAGLAEIDDKMLLKVAAARGIPFTKLMGKSAEGMSATGEGDLKNYYDMVKSDIQEDQITPKLELIDQIMAKKLGMEEPPEWFWNPLYQMSEKEETEVEESRSRTDATYFNLGIISEKEVLERLDKNGTYSGLEERIEELDGMETFEELGSE